MSAVISECGKYRYHLHRPLGFMGNGTCCFVMLNPSTADAMLKQRDAANGEKRPDELGEKDRSLHVPVPSPA